MMKDINETMKAMKEENFVAREMAKEEKLVKDNEALKEERAKRYRKHVHQVINLDESVTVKVTDGHENVLGEETFTKDDMQKLAMEKGEKIIDKKLAKERSLARKKSFEDGLGIYAQYIGYYTIGYAAGYVAVKLIKKVLKK